MSRYDTDILVAGLRSRTGASRKLLTLLQQERYQAIASVAMMFEYEAVLTRPENLSAFGLTVDEVQRFFRQHVVVDHAGYTFFSCGGLSCEIRPTSTCFKRP